MLLSIVEMGGYPDFTSLYQSVGYRVERQFSMRKAQAWLKRNRPQWVVTEFHFDPELRDRTSHLESLLATLQRYSPASRVLVFLDAPDRERFEQLCARFSVDASLEYPIDPQRLLQMISTEP